MARPKTYFTEEERKKAKNKNNKKYRKTHRKELQEYYQNNKERINNKKKEHYKKNKITILSQSKLYRDNHKEEQKIYQKEYRKIHQKEKNDYFNNRLKSDINFRLAHNLRNRIKITLHKNCKSGSAVRDLGCSIPEFKSYLESKFQDGMTWENWGRTGWHIDHIIPLDSFNLQNREEFLKACHYTNLQPLWAEENHEKYNKL